LQLSVAVVAWVALAVGVAALVAGVEAGVAAAMCAAGSAAAVAVALAVCVAAALCFAADLAPSLTAFFVAWIRVEDADLAWPAPMTGEALAAGSVNASLRCAASGLLVPARL
jgi:hypothetical protein